MDDDTKHISVIDTHVHFWKYDKHRDKWITDNMKILREDFLPPMLAGTFSRNGVKGCIAVQADQSELETHFLLELAQDHEIVKGVIGWINLAGEDIAERLEYFSQYPQVKGWRHIVQGEPDGFLLSESFLAGISKLAAYNYTYDILIKQGQLPEAIKFVSKFPDQIFILDHAAKPLIDEEEITEWEKNIRELATYPNVYCKLSGLLTQASWKNWKPAEFYPYLDVLFDAFGSSRLIFGSDWPVMLLSGIYVQWKSMIEKYMEDYSQEEVEKVFGGNAIRVYNL